MLEESVFLTSRNLVFSQHSHKSISKRLQISPDSRAFCITRLPTISVTVNENKRGEKKKVNINFDREFNMLIKQKHKHCLGPCMNENSYYMKYEQAPDHSHEGFCYAASLDLCGICLKHLTSHTHDNQIIINNIVGVSV